MKKFEKMKGPGMAMFAVGSAWHPSLGAEWNRLHHFYPPPFFFPLVSLLRQIQQIGKKRGGEWPRCNQQTIWAPSWVPAPCLYACLIGQKQHAWLCSWGNGETLEWAGGPGLSPYVFLILLVFCLVRIVIFFFKENSVVHSESVIPSSSLSICCLSSSLHLGNV